MSTGAVAAGDYAAGNALAESAEVQSALWAGVNELLAATNYCCVFAICSVFPVAVHDLSPRLFMFAVSTAVRLAAVGVGLCSVKAPSVFRYRVVFHDVPPIVVLLMTMHTRSLCFAPVYSRGYLVRLVSGVAHSMNTY
jgi:hypothetical protein